MTCIISAFSELLAYNLLHMWLAKSCLPSKWFKLLVLHLALNLEGKKKSKTEIYFDKFHNSKNV